MSKIAVIGDTASTIGFKPLGLDAYQIDEPGDVFEVWPTVMASDYAVIMMTETVFEVAGVLIKGLEDRLTPAVLAIPSAAGPIGSGERYIQALVERAVGAAVKGEGTRG